MTANCETNDLIVFSHLRWNFVFQRPQHLISRFAQYRRVFFIETAEYGKSEFPTLHIQEKDNVVIATPHLPADFNPSEVNFVLRDMVDELIFDRIIQNYNVWYYNPMALMYSDHLEPELCLFDCMDELSGFKDCPQEMKDWEQKLLDKAHVVFTGGQSIYEAKKHRHHNIHSLPSSIDFHHFAEARRELSDPSDQANIPHPRIGFYGVIEERIDLELLEKMADLRPDYHFIMVGPVIRLDESLLPRRANIHYLGKKDYSELPNYLASWDCAMMPFALNEATRYISPTKTPEFLAAGKPVVSTRIHDVVHPYSSVAKLVYIADSAEEFVSMIDQAMEEKRTDPTWMERVDSFLNGNSWDATFAKMAALESSAVMMKDNDVRMPCPLIAEMEPRV